MPGGVSNLLKAMKKQSREENHALKKGRDEKDCDPDRESKRNGSWDKKQTFKTRGHASILNDKV